MITLTEHDMARISYTMECPDHPDGTLVSDLQAGDVVTVSNLPTCLECGQAGNYIKIEIDLRDDFVPPFAGWWTNQ